jgi:hypothetical protein
MDQKRKAAGAQHLAQLSAVSKLTMLALISEQPTPTFDILCAAHRISMQCAAASPYICFGSITVNIVNASTEFKRHNENLRAGTWFENCLCRH